MERKQCRVDALWSVLGDACRAGTKLLLCSFSLLSLSLAAQQSTSTHLPIVRIDTQDEAITEGDMVTARMSISYLDGQLIDISHPANIYDGYIGARHRGFTSLSFPKKQYRIETRQANGDNLNVSLLGMPSENDWILSAPFADKSLIRNTLVYEIYRQMGHYAPRSQACELYLDGAYMGLYYLMETVKKDDVRVDISTLSVDEISGDDLTGGYLLKIDRYSGAPCYGWDTPEGVHIELEYPKCETAAEEQNLYIEQYTSEMEQSLMQGDMGTFWQYVDVHSAVDFFIINEIAKNVDAYRLSTFMSKDKDSKGGLLRFGPPWDYNIALGNADFNGGYLIENYIADRHPWWELIRADPYFIDVLKARWTVLRSEGGVLSRNEVLETVSGMISDLGISVDRNFERWDLLGSTVWPNYYVGLSHQDEIDYLSSWLVQRMIWIDTDLELGPFDHIVKAIQFPNPFNFSFTISLDLEVEERVTYTLYDLSGRTIYHRDMGELSAGRRDILFNIDMGEELMTNGFYYLVVQGQSEVLMRKLLFKEF